MSGLFDLALGDVRQILAERIGLEAESVGQTLLRHAVVDHMLALRIEDLGEYVERLRTGPGREFPELVERVIVPETWFFRDLDPYRCLQEFVREQWRPARSGAPLRILSIPCSTGEEPYSVAITLLDLGLGPDEFTVDAVDISRNNLERARLARYGKNAFREKASVLGQPLQAFFHATGESWQVAEPVRRMVRFHEANLAASEFLLGHSPVDVIFCRNLLIYFVAGARERAMEHFARLLAPGGYLYLGHAESSVATTARLEPHDRRYPFAYRFPAARTVAIEPGLRELARRAVPATSVEPSQQPLPRPTAVPAPRPLLREEKTLPAVPARTAPAAVVRAAAAAVDRLLLARQAADSGLLEDAVHCCLEQIAETPTAEAFCLLGTIRQAQGDAAEAERCFHKAAYLDPRHHESLIHLSLSAQRRGDAKAAENFRRRAERSAKL